MYVGNLSKPSRGLDAIDRAIVRVLQRSPDASNRSIADEVGVQEATVARRIRDLVTQRFVRVTIQTNARAVGFEAFGFVDLDIEPGEAREVVKRLSNLDEIFAVYAFVDSPQITAIVMASNQAQLFEFSRKTLANLPGVRNVSAAQSLRMLKFKSHVATLRPRE